MANIKENFCFRVHFGLMWMSRKSQSQNTTGKAIKNTG